MTVASPVLGATHLHIDSAVSSVIHQGAATTKEFYVKNSRWTEGLISASKAVGWGATVMV